MSQQLTRDSDGKLVIGAVSEPAAEPDLPVSEGIAEAVIAPPKPTKATPRTGRKK